MRNQDLVNEIIPSLNPTRTWTNGDFLDCTKEYKLKNA